MQNKVKIIMIYNLKRSVKRGLSFGLTSGIITTMGLITGLHSGVHSKNIIISGILTIAIADSLSDALGIHISEESEHSHSNKEIWEATIATVLSKFICAITFLLPIFLLPLEQAIIASVVWGLSLLSVFSYLITKKKSENPCKAVFEHLFIAILVVLITHFAGIWIANILC